MCGIAGVARFTGSTLPEAVRRMLDLQAHRGPDGDGLQQTGGAVLGHRRLAIIDLSDAAAEPMSNEDGSVWLTYNREIYNFAELRTELLSQGHRFRSRNDGEVLIHGYESWDVAGLLGRLRGMFAFALYDAGKGRLLLARDRLGIKPLQAALHAPAGSMDEGARGTARRDRRDHRQARLGCGAWSLARVPRGPAPLVACLGARRPR